jgi:hypothetical protein
MGIGVNARMLVLDRAEAAHATLVGAYALAPPTTPRESLLEQSN